MERNKERLYEVLRYPLSTEKATTLIENNQFVFMVSKNSTKTEIKKAIEMFFKVSVEKVQVLNQKGKKKMFRGHVGIRNSYKKAIVKLKEGHVIDLSSGV